MHCSIMRSRSEWPVKYAELPSASDQINNQLIYQLWNMGNVCSKVSKIEEIRELQFKNLFTIGKFCFPCRIEIDECDSQS
jgi:hypothetical protein